MSLEEKGSGRSVWGRNIMKKQERESDEVTIKVKRVYVKSILVSFLFLVTQL